MIKIQYYDNELDVVYVKCMCNHTIEEDLSYLETIGKNVSIPDEYDNLSIECGECGRLHYLNMNVPEDEYSEISFEDLVMPFDDIQNRKVLRDIMWAKREDLKELCRDSYNEERIDILHDWRQVLEAYKSEQ